MDPELHRDIQKLRVEIDALLSTLPLIQRTVLKPVMARFFSILQRIAEEL